VLIDGLAYKQSSGVRVFLGSPLPCLTIHQDPLSWTLNLLGSYFAEKRNTVCE
jgi:hypothetical protein